MISTTVDQYAGIILFLVGSIAFSVLVCLVWNTLKPHRPNPEKTSTYECGEASEGSGWYGFNVRFYCIALFFVLFEVELILLYPWALAFNDNASIALWGSGWTGFLLVELIIFVLLLMGGLAYIWKKDYLDWNMEKPEVDNVSSPVPAELYEKLNQKYSSIDRPHGA